MSDGSPDVLVRPSFSGEPNDIAARATRPQSLIISIYGAYSRPMGGWFSVGQLLTMLSQVGVDEPSVRSALSRFKRRGVLVSSKRGGAAGYVLGESTSRTFDVGDARVLGRRAAPANAGWILTSFSIPEPARSLRYQLRSRLASVGLARVDGGLWIGPRQLEPDVRFVVESLRVEGFVDLFSADHIGFQPTFAAVTKWWNLAVIGADYDSFSAEYAGVAARWSRMDSAPSLAPAFTDYTRVLTSWRPLPYRDPGLPSEYLPRKWAGDRATGIFYAIHDRLAPFADEFVQGVVGC